MAGIQGDLGSMQTAILAQMQRLGQQVESLKYMQGAGSVSFGDSKVRVSSTGAQLA